MRRSSLLALSLLHTAIVHAQRHPPFVALADLAADYNNALVGVHADGALGARLGNVTALNAVQDVGGSLRCLPTGASGSSEPRCLFLRYYDGDETGWLFNVSLDGSYNATRDVLISEDLELSALEVWRGAALLLNGDGTLSTWTSGAAAPTPLHALGLANAAGTALCAASEALWVHSYGDSARRDSARRRGAAPPRLGAYDMAHLVDLKTGAILVNSSIVGFIDEGTPPCALACDETGGGAPQLVATLLNPYSHAPTVAALASDGTWRTLGAAAAGAAGGGACEPAGAWDARTATFRAVWASGALGDAAVWALDTRTNGSTFARVTDASLSALVGLAPWPAR